MLQARSYGEVPYLIPQLRVADFPSTLQLEKSPGAIPWRTGYWYPPKDRCDHAHLRQFSRSSHLCRRFTDLVGSVCSENRLTELESTPSPLGVPIVIPIAPSHGGPPRGLAREASGEIFTFLCHLGQIQL